MAPAEFWRKQFGKNATRKICGINFLHEILIFTLQLRTRAYLQLAHSGANQLLLHIMNATKLSSQKSPSFFQRHAL